MAAVTATLGLALDSPARALDDPAFLSVEPVSLTVGAPWYATNRRSAQVRLRWGARTKCVVMYEDQVAPFATAERSYRDVSESVRQLSPPQETVDVTIAGGEGAKGLFFENFDDPACRRAPLDAASTQVVYDVSPPRLRLTARTTVRHGCRARRRCAPTHRLHATVVPVRGRAQIGIDGGRGRVAYRVGRHGRVFRGQGLDVTLRTRAPVLYVRATDSVGNSTGWTGFRLPRRPFRGTLAAVRRR